MNGDSCLASEVMNIIKGALLGTFFPQAKDWFDGTLIHYNSKYSYYEHQSYVTFEDTKPEVKMARNWPPCNCSKS